MGVPRLFQSHIDVDAQSQECGMVFMRLCVPAKRRAQAALCSVYPSLASPLKPRKAGKCMQELGIQTAIVSGGASLAPHLEDFYEAAGLPILNGWGLTETSPVIACRRMCPTSPAANVRGTVGIELPGTSVKYVVASALMCQNNAQV
jgi:long-chain acyl-CoA synthetase